MRRISIVGTSGAGKSTLAAAVARKLDVPHVELDALYHQAGWTKAPPEDFRAAVGALIAAEAWVVDGNYSTALDLVWARADAVVFLDLPRRQVMRQLTWRTLWRGATRQELWNGNRESLRNLLSLDPRRSVLAWAWATYDRNRQRYDEALADPANGHLEFVRLRSRRAIAAFLAGLDPATAEVAS